jgi:hypothetical protein
VLRIILTFGCIAAAVVYVFDAEASPAGRAAVGLAAGASFVIPDTGVVWPITGVLLQLGVCLFVLIRNKIIAGR